MKTFKIIVLSIVTLGFYFWYKLGEEIVKGYSV